MIDFKLLRGMADLAAFLSCDPAQIASLCPSERAEFFEVHQIPKRGRGGGNREVWEVTDETIADIYRGLSRRLAEFLRGFQPPFPHPAAHGYVAGRSTRTNAEVHIGASVILRADIKQFFRSIGFARVQRSLEQAGLSPAAAAALSSIVTFEDHLPLGLPTSPVLANLVCAELDSRLSNLRPGLRYTRYADDLAFSGPELPDRVEIEAVLINAGFAVAEEKWVVARAGRGLHVTGLSLEDRKRPRVPREMKRRVRQDLHHARTHGLAEHIGRRNYSSLQAGVNRIHGTIQYIRGIEREVGDRLQAQWEQILRDEKMRPSYESLRTARAAGEVLFLLDESEFPTASGKCLVLGLAVVEDPELIRDRLEGFRESLLHDAYGLSDRVPLETRGLHWNELAEDDRTQATKVLRELPFRAFVAYDDLPGEDRAAYSEAYAGLLGRLLRGRFGKYGGRPVRILAEQNSRVRAGTVERVVRELLDGAGRSGPLHVTVDGEAAKGSDPALPLPDLLLGVFGAYATSESQAATAAQAAPKTKNPRGIQAGKRFEQVQDKIRAIFEPGSNRAYSRRRAFRPWSTPGPQG